jgi:hypothetical protein
MTRPDQPQPPAPESAAASAGTNKRAERLGEALRENLRRRKAQARGRTPPAPARKQGEPA